MKPINLSAGFTQKPQSDSKKSQKNDQQDTVSPTEFWYTDIPKADKIDDLSQGWLKQAKPIENQPAEKEVTPLTDEAVKQSLTAYNKDPEKQTNTLLNTLKQGYETALKDGNLYSRDKSNLNRFRQTVIPTGNNSYLIAEQFSGAYSHTFNDPESAVSLARVKDGQLLEHAGFMIDKNFNKGQVQPLSFKEWNVNTRPGWSEIEQLLFNKCILLKEYRNNKQQSF